MFMSIKDFKTYILAGKATITIQRDQHHYTYQLKKPEFNPDVIFIKVLTAPDTYTYAGMLKLKDGIIDGPFATKASKMTMSAPSMCFLSRLLMIVNNGEEINFSLWHAMHDGSCGRCGRQLTNPASINAGIGPECASKI